MINESVRTEILARLRRVELEHDIQILFAIESGSRAWGFASPNSDYDVRFIYRHRRDWYETIDVEHKRDVVEYEIVDEIDINGWDVRKALKLFAKSNPGIIEWIQSPIKYIDDGHLRLELLKLVPSVYSPVAGCYHYRSMAKANLKNYLSRDKIKLKKYLYVMRALLAARYVAENKLPPPLPFCDLFYLIEDHDVLISVVDLVKRKTLGGELDEGDHIEVLDEYIKYELSLERYVGGYDQGFPVIDTLNKLFQETLIRQ